MYASTSFEAVVILAASDKIFALWLHVGLGVDAEYLYRQILVWYFITSLHLEVNVCKNVSCSNV